MNSATWILIGESFLILVSLVISVAIYAWRKKKTLLTALDALLTNLSNAEPERKSTLIERLKNSYQIDEAKAKLLSDEIFSAERQFTQKLIQLLLSTGANEIARFNEEMYALLTPYWELLPLDRVADSPPVEQGGESVAVPPVSPDSESDDLSDEDSDLEVSIAPAGAEDLETESTSTLTEESTPEVEINEDDVVEASEVADQPEPIQDPSESDQSQETNLSMPVPPAEELATDKIVDDVSGAASQSEPEQELGVMEPSDSEGYESFVADIVEDDYLAEETSDGVEEEEDEPSWGDAFDEAAQEEEARVINLDENDGEENNSKEVSEI